MLFEQENQHGWSSTQALISGNKSSMQALPAYTVWPIPILMPTNVMVSMMSAQLCTDSTKNFQL
jgi:hypothetical protein